MSIKEIIKAVTPPIVVAGVRKLKRKPCEPDWEYVPEGWAAASRVRGWNDSSVRATYAAGWPAFVASLEGPQPLGGGRDASIWNHNTVVSFAYAITWASRGKSKLSILDWGGGIGRYCLIARAVLPPSVDVVYTCKDVPRACEQGRELVPDAVFCDDHGYLDGRYDFALVSGSLQYVEDWRGSLEQIAAVTDEYLFVTRLPVVRVSPSFVVLQRPYKYGYATEYLSWSLNRSEFLQSASDLGLELVREFLVDATIPVPRAPEAFDFRGFLFRVPERARGSR